MALGHRFVGNVWLSLLPFALLAGQAPQHGSVQFSAAVSVVRLHVSVAGPDGAFISGLTSRDFTLLVNGSGRAILDVQEMDTRSPGSAPSVGSLPTQSSATDLSPGGSDPPPAAVEPGRRFLVFFDLTTRSINVLHARRAFEAAKHFLKTLAPDDQVGLMTFQWKAGLRQLVPFTNDMRRISDVIESLIGSDLGLRVNIRSPDRGAGMLMPLMFLSFSLDPADRRTDILFFSRGDPDASMGYESYVRRLKGVVDRLRASGAVVHTFNPEFLPVSDVNDVSRIASKHSTQGSFDSPPPEGRPDSGSQIPYEAPSRTRRSPSALHEVSGSTLGNRAALYYIAAETGGLSAFYRHTLKAGLEKVEQATRSYYELTFRVLPEDSRSLKVEVVPNRPKMRATWVPREVTITDRN